MSDVMHLTEAVGGRQHRDPFVDSTPYPVGTIKVHNVVDVV